MAQQFLHHSDDVTVFQHVRGEAVAHRVGEVKVEGKIGDKDFGRIMKTFIPVKK